MSFETASCRPGRPKDSAKRAEIVAAATQLFMENGFDQTTMEAVAKKAGVSKLTIYSHFADKKELFRAIVQTRCDEVGMPTSLIEHARESPKKALTDLARYVLHNMFAPDVIRLLRVIHAESLRGSEIPKIFFEYGPGRVKIAFIDLLREFDRQGRLNVPDAALASDQFFALLKGELLQNALILHAPLPTEEIIEAHIKAVLAMFFAVYHPNAKPASM